MLKSIDGPQKFVVGFALLAAGSFLLINSLFKLHHETIAWLFFGFAWFLFAYFQYRAMK